MSHASTCPAHPQHRDNYFQNVCDCMKENLSPLVRYLLYDERIDAIRLKMDELWKAMSPAERDQLTAQKGPHR